MLSIIQETVQKKLREHDMQLPDDISTVRIGHVLPDSSREEPLSMRTSALQTRNATTGRGGGSAGSAAVSSSGTSSTVRGDRVRPVGARGGTSTAASAKAVPSSKARNIHQKPVAPNPNRAEVVQRLYSGGDAGKKRVPMESDGSKVNQEEKALLDALRPSPKEDVSTGGRSSSKESRDLATTYALVDADIAASTEDGEEDNDYYEDTFEAMEDAKPYAFESSQAATESNDPAAGRLSDGSGEEEDGLSLYQQYRSPQHPSTSTTRKVAESKDAPLPGTSMALLTDSKGGLSVPAVMRGAKEMATATATEDHGDELWGAVWSSNRGNMLPSSSELIMPNQDHFDSECTDDAKTIVSGKLPPPVLGALNMSPSRISSDSMYMTLAEPSVMSENGKQREVSVITPLPPGDSVLGRID